MDISADELAPQVHGSINALEKLSAKEREKTPYGHFADDYNRLLWLAKKSLPSIPEKRWPAEIEKTLSSKEHSQSKANYVEIHAYLNQIAVILEQNIEPPMGSMG